MQAFVEHPHVSGIAMPDVKGIRHFYDFATQNTYRVEADEQHGNDEIIQVGRFMFLAEAFQKANQALKAASDETQGWVVIDEVGKLELQNSGLHEGLEKILSTKYKVKSTKGEDRSSKYKVQSTKGPTQNHFKDQVQSTKNKGEEAQNFEAFKETGLVNILLVVRDTLLLEVIKKYGLQDTYVVDWLSKIPALA